VVVVLLLKANPDTDLARQRQTHKPHPTIVQVLNLHPSNELSKADIEDNKKE